MAMSTKIHPLFFAPFVSSTMQIEPGWIDSYGHLNMAYYHVIFERGIDEALKMIGITPEYDTERRLGIFTAECHIHYRREVLLETPVRITAQLLDYDDKRLHFYLEMRHATEGWLAAMEEILFLNVDLKKRRVTPFPDDILEQIAVMKAAHSALPKPDILGQSVGIPPRAKSGKVGLH